MREIETKDKDGNIYIIEEHVEAIGSRDPRETLYGSPVFLDGVYHTYDGSRLNVREIDAVTFRLTITDDNGDEKEIEVRRILS